jgi:hypothetical protein
MEAIIGQKVRGVRTRGGWVGGRGGGRGQGGEEVRGGGGEGRGEVGSEVGQGRRRGRGRGRGVRNTITDEIRATMVDHVVTHGMSMREAGQPNLSRYTVAGIISK